MVSIRAKNKMLEAYIRQQLIEHTSERRNAIAFGPESMMFLFQNVSDYCAQAGETSRMEVFPLVKKMALEMVNEALKEAEQYCIDRDKRDAQSSGSTLRAS